MSNTFGDKFRLTTFGESHGTALGVVIDGVKPGLKISKADIQKELNKRKPGKKLSSARKEADIVHILSGIFNGITTGHPICLVVYNKDAKSKDYQNLKNVFRPGHADFTYFKKYGIRDYRGGGRQSGRETISRVAAGAVAKKILKKIKITAYTIQVSNIIAKKRNLSSIKKNIFKCPDLKAAKQMISLINKIKQQKESTSCVIECVIKNLPAGIGNPVFDKLEADLAFAIMSIPGVKGIEFGSGFSSKLGSENNDEFILSSKATKTNNAGGILGGISTGNDIVFRVAVKPPSSIGKKQSTIDLKGKKRKILIKGRHDPCLSPRIIPVIESMAYIALANKLK